MESSEGGLSRLTELVGPGHALFAYGTLQFPEVLEVLLGRVPLLEVAELPGWRAAILPRRVYPGLVVADGGLARGCVLGDLTAAEWAILDAFEDDEYDLRQVRVAGWSEPVWTYVWTAGTDPGDWHRDRFAADHLVRFAARSVRWRCAPAEAVDPGASVWSESVGG
ncbi:gamma-glutamylcyclotransferase family protein [Nocardia sp. NPDC049220]|uniref:gamma-glutamylcyclotransferase family protein n=1 Tax=Nocardia sp. NPDC049220 TaxID=3155273 RepID=UPI003403382B